MSWRRARRAAGQSWPPVSRFSARLALKSSAAWRAVRRLLSLARQGGLRYILSFLLRDSELLTPVCCARDGELLSADCSISASSIEPRPAFRALRRQVLVRVRCPFPADRRAIAALARVPRCVRCLAFEILFFHLYPSENSSALGLFLAQRAHIPRKASASCSQCLGSRSASPRRVLPTSSARFDSSVSTSTCAWDHVRWNSSASWRRMSPEISL